ncbi:Na+/H+ antiporter NhaC family protein [Marinomonas pollencensis]|uniref:Transporter (NhaC family) n=1 Tax=Marinomonas pollencensis TaxID=491954 RepID=A0A3E0D9Z8_9GAMM|nr:Na+/H+ antiporter NhaC family protein [Marinomonas pollencensis]REG79353.1 transporter (NhaC family) [Marinomonas pollencensis]
MTEQKKLTFYGGPWVSFLPILSFVAVAIYVAIALDEATIQGMWVGILAGLLVTFLLAKDKSVYTETIMSGMASKVAIAPVAAWIFAGIFATVLRSSGLVDGILWAAYHTGATGTAFVAVSFIASALFATAAGTGFGTIAAGMGVLYPAGVLLGADPLLMAGAIVGGGAFGDNLAPISDTTISSAASQNTDIGGVVRSRLKYSLVAGAITLVLLVVFSLLQSGASGRVPYEQLAEHMNPKGLIMLLPALVAIYVAMKKGDVIFATSVGILLGMLVAVLSGLNTVESFISVKDGALINGVAGWMADLSILVLLLAGGIRLMLDGGGSDRLIAILKNLVRTPRGAEASSAILSLFLSAMMSINAPAILAVGLSYAKPVGERFKLHPYRRANIIDSMACTLVYSLPWSAALLFASGLSVKASEAFQGVPPLTPLEMTPWIFYAWVLLAVMTFSIMTGWGRRFMDGSEEQKDGEVMS